MSAVQWIGHATTLIEVDGVRLLTDPLLTDGFLGYIRRRTPHPVDPAAAERLDAVLISHAHQDHLHLRSLRRLAGAPRIIVPTGAGAWLSRHGFRGVEEIAPGERTRVGGLTVHATPALHQGFRIPFGPRADALGYVVQGSASVYFGGDTDLFEGMRDIGEIVSGGLDLALLPVGGWGPTLRGGHMDPERAALALAWLRPRMAVPIHWGTYWPMGLGWFRRARFEQPGEAFRRAAALHAPGVEVHVPAPGGVVPLPAPSA